MSVTKDAVQEFEEHGYSEEEYKQLEQLYSGTMGKINAGEIVKGRIVHIGDSNVAVDIGFKSEGTVAKSEFPNIKDLKIGDEIEVFLESIEDKDGQLVSRVNVPTLCVSGNASLNPTIPVKFLKDAACAGRKAVLLSILWDSMHSCRVHKSMFGLFVILMYSSDARWISAL